MLARRKLRSNVRNAANGLLGVLALVGPVALLFAQTSGLSEPEHRAYAVAPHAGDLSGIWNGYRPESERAFGGWAFSAELPPMTPWAQARFEQARPTFGPNSFSVADTNDPVYDCFPPGAPRIYFHPFPMEIIQTPGRVMMVFEYDHFLRQIYTDGREHRTDLSPSWMGDATGHWEGDTLVVETVNFNDKTWIDRRGVPHSEELRVIERIRRVDENSLVIDITIEDPIAFTETWTGRREYRAVDWDVEEFICMDNISFEVFESEVLESVGGQLND